MKYIFKYIFFLFLVRPLVYILLGLNIKNAEYLPDKGPAIIAANHNSHLDTLVLMSVFPLKLLRKIRPLAAADYFLRNSVLSWFSQSAVGIIPVERQRKDRVTDPLENCKKSLADSDIIILFPEGTRGEMDRMAKLKKGIAYLAEAFPQAPVIPVYLNGLGRSLPKGSWIPVPFFCDVLIGEPLRWQNSHQEFVDELEKRIISLSKEGV